MAVTSAPTAIGDYRVERLLGRGAFGVVYRAHHKDRPDTPLAVKVVAGRGDTDRLLLEPAVLSRLEHPCIVGLEDYFLRGNDLVLALEFVDGQDLKTMLDEGHEFGQDDVRDLLLQIGSALSVAHARNVVHRDLKPANILVATRPEGGRRFVLTDFGIGQVREGVQTEKRTGGTYLYMAPEQLRGRPAAQSDLWALGVVAYRLLAGRLPFPGPSLKDLTNQILYGSLPPPSAAREGVDPELERAVLHLLDRSLNERTASAEALLRELGHRGPADTVLTHRPGPARPVAGRSLDRELKAGISWRVVVIAFCVLLYMLPGGLVPNALMSAGLYLFYLGQKEAHRRARAAWLTLASLALLLTAQLFNYVPALHPYALGMATISSQPAEDWPRVAGAIQRVVPPELLDVLLVVAIVLGVVLYVLYLFLPIIGGALLATVRRLQREKLLRDLAQEGDAGSARYLEALRDALDSRFEDVGLHLKYAEAMFARGRLAEAAVEARILLRQDPFHFNGNLLLANAYHQLGLYAECVDLCESYLEVSGYCFEFAELRDQCRKGEAA